jgi:hypothetical protein
VPKVRRTIWVEKHVMVDWSPDDATMLNSGAVAGMEFLKRMEEYRQNVKHTTAGTATYSTSPSAPSVRQSLRRPERRESYVSNLSPELIANTASAASRKPLWRWWFGG